MCVLGEWGGISTCVCEGVGWDKYMCVCWGVGWDKYMCVCWGGWDKYMCVCVGGGDRHMCVGVVGQVRTCVCVHVRKLVHAVGACATIKLA